MLVRYALTHKRVLDVDLMNLAAKELIGLKDFAAFCKPRAGASTIRNLTTFQVSRDPGGLITIEIHADAFCHNMIRSLVGSIMAVADGRLSIQDLIQAQKSGKRANKFKTIDAKGLSLESIDYPDPADYAKQANLNRVMREISDNSV
jgi:tRNA pseudouridine38-40 synthase